MAQVLKSKDIPKLEGWGILVALLAFEFIGYLIFYFCRRAVFPSLPIDFLDLGVKAFAYLIIFLLCIIRFGKITVQELIPSRKGILLLVITIAAVTWVFDFFVGSEGMRNQLHESIKDIPTLYYSLSLLIIIGIVPFFEEAIFRRYFLEIQRQYYSNNLSVFITASVSTILHFNFSENLIPILIWTFIIQSVFGFLYIHGRLGVPVLAHLFVNGLSMILSR